MPISRMLQPHGLSCYALVTPRLYLAGGRGRCQVQHVKEESKFHLQEPHPWDRGEHSTLEVREPRLLSSSLPGIKVRCSVAMESGRLPAFYPCRLLYKATQTGCHRQTQSAWTGGNFPTESLRESLNCRIRLKVRKTFLTSIRLQAVLSTEC